MSQDRFSYLLSHNREAGYYFIDRELGILATLPNIPAWSNREIARSAGGEEVIFQLAAEEFQRPRWQSRDISGVNLEEVIYSAGLEAVRRWADRII